MAGRAPARAFAILVATWAIVAWPTLAAAHGEGGPSLEVVPNPGVVGDSAAVLCEELQPLGAVTVDLLTADGAQRVLVGQVDDLGHFSGSFVVPQLPARVYELRATDSAGLQVSFYLTVVAGVPATEPFVPLSPLGLVLVALLGAAAVATLVLTLGSRRRQA